jgi:hypothetical protein
MYQQINLYQPVFRHQQKIVSARTMLQIVALAGLVVCGFYCAASWNLYQLRSTSAALARQFDALNSRLVQLEAAQGTDNGGDITTLQHRLDTHRQLYQRLEQLLGQAGNGFSQVFDALANQTLPGLWLTGITLSGAGNTELRGTTVDPELIPRYLLQLSGEPGLGSLPDGSITLARRDGTGTDIDFVLQGHPPGVPVP